MRRGTLFVRATVIRLTFLPGLDARLARWPANAVLLVSLAISVGLGVLDRFTEVELLVLYLIPLFMASWYGGRRPGLVIAVYDAIAVLLVAAIEGRPLAAADYVAAAVRGVAYAIIALMVSNFQESRRRQRELTGFVVHDLRSPIASTITGLQTLEIISEDAPEDQREMVALALVSANRALTLVNSILDVSKLEGGRMEVVKEPVEIGPWVHTRFEELALWAQSAEVEMVDELQVERFAFDPELTGRVLVNLLSNALKYSPPGGKVRVLASLQGGALRVSVIDQGSGIPAAYVEKVFDPFVQVAGTKGGTGLGLAFCRLAIHAQHGRIWAESPPGQGASMHFQLPP